jgi:hypothetical protein
MLTEELTSTKRDQNDSELNATCEAVGCYSKAVYRIAVKVGNLGEIPLLLCSNCVTKFQDAKDEANLRFLPNHGKVGVIT